MNRREIIRGIAALGLTPALPAPALTRAAPVAAGMSSTAQHMYFMGWYTARVHDRCSPAMLQRLLKLEGPVADEIYGQLLNRGVITAPDAFGISRAVDPLHSRWTTGLNQASQVGAKPPPRSAKKAAKKAAETLDDETLRDINHDAEMSRDAEHQEPDSPKDDPEIRGGGDGVDPSRPVETRGSDDLPEADTAVRGGEPSAGSPARDCSGSGGEPLHDPQRK